MSHPTVIRRHSEKHKFFERSKWTCVFCQHRTTCGSCDPSSPKQLHATIDHIDALSTGGAKSARSNLQLLCYACNQVKSNYPIANYYELCELVYAIQAEGHPVSLKKLTWELAIEYATLRIERKPGRAHVYRCRYRWCQQWHILMTSQVA